MILGIMGVFKAFLEGSLCAAGHVPAELKGLFPLNLSKSSWLVSQLQGVGDSGCFNPSRPDEVSRSPKVHRELAVSECDHCHCEPDCGVTALAQCAPQVDFIS